MRIRRSLCVGLLGAGVFPAVVSAQATGDEARLTLGLHAGVVTGSELWSASPQAVQFITPADTFGLERRIRSTVAVGFQGTYFPGQTLGFAGEAFLVGLGFEDSCRHEFTSGQADVVAVCDDIQGQEKAATSVILSAGPIVRFKSRGLFSPYARANLGVVISNHSSIRTEGTFPTDSGSAVLIVYSDDKNSRVDPALALGVGFTAAIAKGYGLRLEFRDNIVGVQKVTGTVPVAGNIPPHERVYKHLFSVTIGFDVILERTRGRRY